MKGKISNWDAIAHSYCKNSNSGQEFKLQVKFPAKNTLTPMSRHSSTIGPIGIHKQAIKKKWTSRIWKTSWRTKATISDLRRCYTTIPLILDFTDKKSWFASEPATFAVQMLQNAI